MSLFPDTDLFKSRNVGVALNEGLANPTDKFTVFYGKQPSLLEALGSHTKTL